MEGNGMRRAHSNYTEKNHFKGTSSHHLLLATLMSLNCCSKAAEAIACKGNYQIQCKNNNHGIVLCPGIMQSSSTGSVFLSHSSPRKM